MTDSTFDMSGLNDRINKIKKEGEENSDFIHEFLQCLMERHDLKFSIPDHCEMDNVPQELIENLKEGTLPSKERLILLDTETQNALLFDMLWMCGMHAIAFYTKDIPEALGYEQDNEYFESVIAMLDVSPGHYIGCYIIAAYTLLMCKVPTIEMIEIITGNFESEQEQLQKSQDIFMELAAGVLTRWREDRIYYLLDYKEAQTEEN